MPKAAAEQTKALHRENPIVSRITIRNVSVIESAF